MKQKMVVKVSMHGPKSRSKAMKIAVSLSGVESAALIGEDRAQIEVIGDQVDAVKLTIQLRKNVGSAELVSVAAVEAKKPEPEKPKPPQEPVIWSYYCPCGAPLPCYFHY